MIDTAIDALRAHAAYGELVRRRRRLAFGLAGTLCALCLAFGVASALAPAALARPLGPGAPWSLGVALAFSLCVLAVAFAAWYAWRAEAVLAPLERRLLDDLSEPR